MVRNPTLVELAHAETAPVADPSSRMNEGRKYRRNFVLEARNFPVKRSPDCEEEHSAIITFCMFMFTLGND